MTDLRLTITHTHSSHAVFTLGRSIVSLFEHIFVAYNTSLGKRNGAIHLLAREMHYTCDMQCLYNHPCEQEISSSRVKDSRLDEYAFPYSRIHTCIFVNSKARIHEYATQSLRPSSNGLETTATLMPTVTYGPALWKTRNRQTGMSVLFATYWREIRPFVWQKEKKHVILHEET